jgi:hypothetical protein
MAVASGGAAALASLATGAVAHAANTYTVTNLNDAGTGSLRAAIDQVNADTSDTAGPGDSIVFATGLTGTISLSTAADPYDSLLVQRPVQIAGPGANLLTLRADSGHRVLYFDPTSGVTNPMPAKVSGLTVTGGTVTSGVNGAGIKSYQAALELDGVTVSGNTAPYCAGICEVGYGSLTMNDSTVSGNTSTASHAAGGIFAYTTTINDSTVTGNSGAFGAGIDLYGPAQITDSTIAGNTSSRADAGQVEEDKLAAAVTLRDSIVSGSGANPDVALSSGSTGSASFSLIRNASAPTGDVAISTDATDVVGKDPQLGALASNGGPTQTMLPAATSPVLDQGNAFGLTTDQRGLSRPFELPMITSVPAGGDRSDIGAVEVHETVVDAISPSSGTGGTQVTITGGDFTGASAVMFGSAPASSFTVLSDSEIVATAPPQNGGTVDVRVISPGGESPALALDQFTFQTNPPTPRTFTPKVSKPHAKLSGKEVKTGIRVSCPAGGFRCSGSFQATAFIKHHRTKLAAGKITLAAGHSKTITFKLSKKALKELEKTGHLKIMITIVVADGNGKKLTVNRTFTIKPAHHKKHHHKSTSTHTGPPPDEPETAGALADIVRL